MWIEHVSCLFHNWIQALQRKRRFIAALLAISEDCNLHGWFVPFSRLWPLRRRAKLSQFLMHLGLSRYVGRAKHWASLKGFLTHYCLVILLSDFMPYRILFVGEAWRLCLVPSLPMLTGQMYRTKTSTHLCPHTLYAYTGSTLSNPLVDVCLVLALLILVLFCIDDGLADSYAREECNAARNGVVQSQGLSQPFQQLVVPHRLCQKSRSGARMEARSSTKSGIVPHSTVSRLNS